MARYHSLIAKKDTIPDELSVTAVTDDGEVMAVKHRDYEIFGVQFHPESIMTPDGMKMLEKFFSLNGGYYYEKRSNKYTCKWQRPY